MPDKLWKNGDSSEYSSGYPDYPDSKGKNGRIPESEAAALKGSLFLIQPEEAQIIIIRNDFGKMKARAEFDFNGCLYNLSVTDPEAESRLFRKGEGKYPIARPYLCVSLGEPFKGYCYKLAAAVIF